MSHYFATTIVLMYKYSQRNPPFTSFQDGFPLYYFLVYFLLDPPLASEKCHSIRAVEGSHVSLSCPTDGNPAPVITWYKGSGLYGNMLSSGKEL